MIESLMNIVLVAIIVLGVYIFAAVVTKAILNTIDKHKTQKRKEPK